MGGEGGGVGGVKDVVHWVVWFRTTPPPSEKNLVVLSKWGKIIKNNEKGEKFRQYFKKVGKRRKSEQQEGT